MRRIKNKSNINQIEMKYKNMKSNRNQIEIKYKCAKSNRNQIQKISNCAKQIEMRKIKQKSNIN